MSRHESSNYRYTTFRQGNRRCSYYHSSTRFIWKSGNFHFLLLTLHRPLVNYMLWASLNINREGVILISPTIPLLGTSSLQIQSGCRGELQACASFPLFPPTKPTHQLPKNNLPDFLFGDFLRTFLNTCFCWAWISCAHKCVPRHQPGGTSRPGAHSP